jgi:hypothetical protein
MLTDQKKKINQPATLIIDWFPLFRDFGLQINIFQRVKLFSVTSYYYRIGVKMLKFGGANECVVKRGFILEQRNENRKDCIGNILITSNIPLTSRIVEPGLYVYLSVTRSSVRLTEERNESYELE